MGEPRPADAPAPCGRVYAAILAYSVARTRSPTVGEADRPKGSPVTLAPWEYLFVSFNSHNFHDLFWPTIVVSIVGLVAVVALYNVRTRQLHRHPPYLDLYEWLLWTGVITFFLLVMYGLFVFDFLFVLLTELIGLGTLVWIRFVRFPPILAGYERQLARQRYFSRQRFTRPESTIRTKPARRRRRR